MHTHRNVRNGIHVEVFIFLLFGLVLLPSIAFGATYYVSPGGDDAQSGIAAETSVKTIQKAIDMAQPGDTVMLAAGEYPQDMISRRNGTADAPITITGPKTAVVRGAGADRVIEINHHYHTLNGFTVDGLAGSVYHDKLIYVLGKEARKPLVGLKITNMTVKNSGGECIRLRYFVTGAEIAHNTIGACGAFDFIQNAGGKNGEGIYVGTSSKQWNDGKNPTNDPDETKGNVIHHNTINTQGNECVDIKEGATGNIVEYNTCTGQRDAESGGFDSRGSNNTFRYNSVKGSLGVGIRFGGWLVNGIQYGKGNDAYGNAIEDNKAGAFKFETGPQGKICENALKTNAGGSFIGGYAVQLDPAQSCSGITVTVGGASSAGSGTPAPAPSSAPAPSPSTQPSLAANASSLANGNTLVASSSGFSEGYDPAQLWDGCYEGASYDSTKCTTGGRDISSFWLQFDLKKPHALSQARLYGDAEGEWVSKSWSIQYKQGANDSWKTAFSEKDASSNSWSTQTLGVIAQYVRAEVIGGGRAQARELEIFGTETAAVTASVAQSLGGGGGSSAGSGSAGGGGGGGGGSSVQIAQSGGGGGGGGGSSGGGGGGGGWITPLAPTIVNPQFKRTLYLGVISPDVKKLQQSLNMFPDTRVASVGLGSPGRETAYFGLRTREALRKFQKKHGVISYGTERTTGYGMMGPRTRMKLNEVFR